MSDEGTNFIISHISGKLTDLEISENHCGEKACSTLGQSICSKNFQNLLDLNLRKNNISDSGAGVLFFSVMINKTLRKLDLSENNLTYRCSESLKNCLQSNISLYELYLSWNNFNFEAGTAIFCGLCDNYSLKVLDLSYNQMGKAKEKEKTMATAKNIADFLMKNETGLLHLDLSHNSFDIEACEVISQGLAENQMIYGFHFEGNAASVDCQGFLITQSHQNGKELFLKPKSYRINGVRIAQMHHENLVSDIHNFNDYQELNHNFPFEGTSNCWICEGWAEKKFILAKSNKGTEAYLHLNFNNYQPLMMKIKKEKFVLKCMCPPKKEILFFYTVQGAQILDNSKDIVKNRHPNLRKIKFGQRLIDIYVPILNIIKNLQATLLFDSNYNPLFQTLPRTKQEQGEFPMNLVIIAKNDNWQIQNSFYFREEYTEKFEQNRSISWKIFETDWKKSNLSKKINQKDDSDSLKLLLKNIYSNFIDTYVNYTSRNSKIDCFLLPKSLLFEFCVKSGINFNKILTHDEINTVFSSIKAQYNEESGDCMRKDSVNRHEFLEFLVKIAHFKQNKKSLTPINFSNSFKLTLENGLFSYFNSYNRDPWRLEKLWKEDCEKILQFYNVLINGLFENYASTSYFKGQYLMDYTEFCDLFETSQIFNKKNWAFEIEELKKFFLLSIGSKVDELSGRGILMNFMEFFEGLARVAERLSPVPVNEDEKKYPLSIRKTLPLHVKIEGLIHILYKHCFSDKEEFSFPSKSIFDLNSVAFKSPRMSNRYILQKQSSINVPENEDSGESLQTKEDLSKIENNRTKRDSFNKTSKKSHYSEIKKILRQMI